MSFNGKKRARNEQMDRFMFMKIFGPRGLSAPAPRVIYMRMTKIFKHLLFGNRFANQSQTLCGAKFGRGMKVCINSQGHMTKMAINNKKMLKIFFFRTRRPMILKLGMKHQGMELYKIYINDPGMTLTYFTARST